MIMIIAIIYILLSYVIFDQQLKIRKVSENPQPPQKKPTAPLKIQKVKFLTFLPKLFFLPPPPPCRKGGGHYGDICNPTVAVNQNPYHAYQLHHTCSSLKQASTLLYSYIFLITFVISQRTHTCYDQFHLPKPTCDISSASHPLVHKGVHQQFTYKSLCNG